MPSFYGRYVDCTLSCRLGTHCENVEKPRRHCREILFFCPLVLQKVEEGWPGDFAGWLVFSVTACQKLPVVWFLLPKSNIIKRLQEASSQSFLLPITQTEHLALWEHWGAFLFLKLNNFKWIHRKKYKHTIWNLAWGYVFKKKKSLLYPYFHPVPNPEVTCSWPNFYVTLQKYLKNVTLIHKLRYIPGVIVKAGHFPHYIDSYSYIFKFSV